MQSTPKTSVAECVTSIVWNFINNVRGNFSISEIFTSSLTVLYAYHKGYDILMNNRRLQFTHNDDFLYSDLIQLIPNDRHLHYELCHLVDKVSEVDRLEYNSVYVDVLKSLFDLVSSSSGREGGEFYTPSTVTKLIAYIVNNEKCNKVLDPFCGTASIIHELSKFENFPSFFGQELAYKTSIFARINAEALYGSCDCIANVNSIVNWNRDQYDAVVSCPPLGLRLSPDEMMIARHVTPECECRSFEDIILSRPFCINHAKLSVTHLTTGFCFRGDRGSRDYMVRRELVENNLLDTIIALPSNILYGTSIPSIILVCKKWRNQDDPIKFIHADDYFLGDRRKRIFDYDRFVKMVEGNPCDVAEVSIDEIRQYDYNLNPSLYYKKDFKLKDGQKVVRLNDLLAPIEGNSISADCVTESVSINNLSRDFIEILLNNSKSSPCSEHRRSTGYRSVDASDAKYFLAFSGAGESRFGINTDSKGFVHSVDIKVYKINEELVTPEYLAYLLTNHNSIGKGRMPLSGYMMLPIVIDSLEKQKELTNREIQLYEQKVNAEREADALRLGVKQNVSDLEHMLGSIQHRISKLIVRLEKATPSSNNYPHLVKSIKDNVEYMNRVIHYNNANIDTETFNIKEGNIIEFINSYVDAWNNYGGEYFDISIQNFIHDNINFSFDKTLLIVMLDSILNNAIRHGFHKRKTYTERNLVEISTSIVEYNTRPYVLLSVANNGDPISDGFTINDYISRGRFSASTGRSGLGGYHVFQVVKGHNGYMYLDSNKVWNMVVDILLPINSSNLKDIPIYEKECL